jgi:hypothetical protein
MATSQQPLPQGTPFTLSLDQGINLDNVNENIYTFDAGAGAHLTNTGINRDDGITNLYATAATSSDSKVFYAPNGKQVTLNYSQQTVSVDGSALGSIGGYGLSARTTVPFGAVDFALTSSGTGLALVPGTSTGLTNAFQTTGAPGGGWIAIAYGNGLFVAVAQTTSTTAGIATSPDGITWTFRSTTAPGGTGWKSVTYGNGLFVAVAPTTLTTDGIATSPDGITWTFRTTPTPGGAGWSDVTYGNGLYVAVCNTASTTAGIATSPDGITWTFRTTGTPGGNWSRVTYGNGLFVATALTTSTTAGIATSPDGITWTFRTTTTPGGFWQTVAYGNGLFVATASTTSTTAGIATSPDGITWTFQTTTAPGGSGWLSVTYGNGLFMAVAFTTSTTAGIATSPDGITWTFRTTGTPGAGWIDVASGNGIFVAMAFASTTTTSILLFSTTAVNAYRVIEYNLTTKAILNTTLLATAFTNLPNYACLVKGHQMTFATADVAYIYFTGTTVNAAVFVSGVSKTAFSGTGKPSLYTGISAFKNGGTYIIGGICDNTTMPKSYYAASPYSSWTTINETSYLSTYENLNTASSLALNLIGIPSTLSTANWTTFGTKVSIATNGTVTTTTVTQTGLTIVPGDTYSGFGWASGRFKSTAATKFSPFVLDNAGTPVTITETVTDYQYRPVPACSIGNTAAQKAFIYGIGVTDQQGKNAKPAQVVWGGGVGAMPISEYGIDNTQPVTQWLDANGVYWVAVPMPNGTIELSTIGANTYQMFPISRDVIQLTDSYGTIVNTATGAIEVNSGSMCPSLVSDIYLNGTNQIAYQTNYVESNSADFGSVATVVGVGATAMTITTISGGVLLPIIVYQSASGTLFAKALYSGGAQIATDTTVAYVPNPNLPPPVDSVYAGGGVQMIGQSALQTINFADGDGFAQYYAGYTLANQYPISYQFFNLFGQLYGFDGQKIYRMPVNGGTAGTPEQIALAQGLTFVCNSPISAYFTSAFENAMYVFTGSARVDKWQQMTGESLVTSGVFSVRENSLYLQLSDNTILTFRDSLSGRLANVYTSQTIYATDLGTYFVNTATPSQSTLWSYYAGTGTPITLTWQSGFFGFGRNQYCRVTQWNITLKVADSTTTDITINYNWLTENTNGTETKTFLAGTYTTSSTGYTRLQLNPTQSLVWGSSLGIMCNKKVVLYEAVCYYTDGGVGMAVPSNMGP